MMAAVSITMYHLYTFATIQQNDLRTRTDVLSVWAVCLVLQCKALFNFFEMTLGDIFLISMHCSPAVVCKV